MSFESDPGLRRVSVHAGSAVVDLALPAAVPIVTLIPSIIDLLAGRGDSSTDGIATRYQLSRLGSTALAPSTTLAQHGIVDGAVLILSRSTTALPAPRYDDVAEAVAEALDTAAPFWTPRAARRAGALAAICFTGLGAVALLRNNLGSNVDRHAAATACVAAIAGIVAVLSATIAHRVYRDRLAGLALSLVTTVFAAVAGLLAVPDAPGVSRVLLAAMAAAVTSALALRLTGCGVVTLTAVACFALVVAVAALAGELAAAPSHVTGSLTALVSLFLLGMAPRTAITLTGLTPSMSSPPDPDTPDRLAAKAIRAEDWLVSLSAALSSSAVAGALVPMLCAQRTGTPRLADTAFAGATGALLLLRARTIEGRTKLIFTITGIGTTGTTFAVATNCAPDSGPWIAGAAATLAAAAIYLGFVAPGMSLSPIARRGVDLLECLVLIAIAPLTFWVCGAFNAVRGLNLT